MAGETAGGAALVGLVHGDVQPGVADGFAEDENRLGSPSSARIVTDVIGPIP